MADDNNPLADIYNAAALPYMLGPNKYSAFNGNPLSLQGYSGTPTDAQGRPIQSFVSAQQQHDAWNAANPAPAQGTTLNSTPTNAGLEAQGSQARAMQDAGYGNWATLDPLMAQSPRPSPTAGTGSVGATTGWNPNNPASIYPTAAGGAAGGSLTPMGGSGSGGAGVNPVDMRQAYLTALSNPGPVTTPGANVPQSAPAGQQPNVLDAFLAHNAQPQAPGAGGYSNAGFFNTLRGLRQGAA